MFPNKVWTDQEFEADRQEAIRRFVEKFTAAMKSPLRDYMTYVEAYRVVLDELFRTTDDLRNLEDAGGIETLAARAVPKGGGHYNNETLLFTALRFLTGPFLSTDDLKNLAGVERTQTAMREDPDAVIRIYELIRLGLDHFRFPWLQEQQAVSGVEGLALVPLPGQEGRNPTAEERRFAIDATAVLMATARSGADRRATSGSSLENQVRAEVRKVLTEVRTPANIESVDALAPGSFCGGTTVCGRRMDLVARAMDGRFIPLECKASATELNSRKRITHSVSSTGSDTLTKLGTHHVRPVGVLEGCFALVDLKATQGEGVNLFWAHRLDDLIAWIKG